MRGMHVGCHVWTCFAGLLGFVDQYVEDAAMMYPCGWLLSLEDEIRGRTLSVELGGREPVQPCRLNKLSLPNSVGPRVVDCKAL